MCPGRPPVSAEVDIEDWTTAERCLTTWPLEVEGLGCSSFETKFILEAPLRDYQAEVTAASCKAPVVTYVVTRSVRGGHYPPQSWPLCEEHLAWHVASDLVRHRRIVATVPVS